jgi:CubicO group peptidase (beta-lactamase class C family)
MMDRRQFGAFFGSSVLALAANPAVARARRAPDWSWADAMAEAARIGWRAPGAAVAIVQNGATVYMRGFGRTAPENGAVVGPGTLFGAASVTKAFTAAGSALLVDGGVTSWDAPVRRLLPAFQMAGGPAYDDISLRDMLSHRTGLPRHDLLWYNSPALSREEVLRRLPYLAVSAPPRARYQYNNLMYILAGHACECAVGQPWEAFLAERLLTPLGMTRAFVDMDLVARESDRARGHFLNAQKIPESIPLRPEDRIGPAGTLFASVSAYARWMLLQLGRGQIDGRRVFSRAQADAMWEPTILAGGAPESADYTRPFYGLGWRIDTYRGLQRVHHGGNLNGFSARVTLFPDLDVGIAVLANLGGSPMPGHLTQDLFDRLAGLAPRNWSAQMLQRRDAAEATARDAGARKSLARVPDTTPSRPLAGFEGVYRHPGYGDLTIAARAGQLAASYNAMPMRLAHWHFDVFNAEPERLEDEDLADLKFVFRTDADGAIEAVSTAFEEAVEPIVFARQVDPRWRDGAFLARFAGDYAGQGRRARITVAGSDLQIALDDGPARPADPKLEGRFAIRGRDIGFRFDEGPTGASTLVLVDPSGGWAMEKAAVVGGGPG